MTATAAPSRPATGVTQNDILSEDFWKRNFSTLSIGRLSARNLHNQGQPHQQPLERIHARMMRDGYFGDSDPNLLSTVKALGDAVKQCVEMGLPPVFIFLFDEAWESFFRLNPVISHLIGRDYKLLPDFWAWHVDPKKKQNGWTPHRDKGSISLAPDGSPLSLTVWIPLSDANPMNSCIYMVPSHLDPTYRTPQEKSLQVPAYNIRALPAQPGDYLCWNQCVYHWGAPSSEFADDVRMSMALEFQRGDIQPFNAPLLDPLTYPDFETRLRLMAKQILQYQHMYGFSQELRDIAAHIIQKHTAI
jgi:hypothetical protein